MATELIYIKYKITGKIKQPVKFILSMLNLWAKIPILVVVIKINKPSNLVVIKTIEIIRIIIKILTFV